MKTAGVLLGAWRVKAGISQADAAKKVGINQSRWARLELDQAEPRIALAVRIEQVTEGAVPTTAWVRRDGAGRKTKAA